MDLVKNAVAVLTLVALMYAGVKWAVPWGRRNLAAWRERRLRPQMEAMAERITALENELAWQKDFVRDMIREGFAWDRKQLAFTGDLLNEIYEMAESRIRDSEYDRGTNEHLIAILKELYEQVDHLWDAHTTTLTLIESGMKLTQQPHDNPPEAPELKSA